LNMTLPVILQITAAIAAGSAVVVVAIINNLATRKKTAAEIAKLNEETNTIRLQNKKLQESFDNVRTQNEKLENSVDNLSDKVRYGSNESTLPNETILYSIDQSDGYDFRLVNAENAAGDFELNDGILSIRRQNTVGTMQLWLESYKYPHLPPSPKLLKNQDISGDRKLRMSCEVKAEGGEHTLLFVFKGENDPLGVHLAERRARVTHNEWTPVEAYFWISPAKNCHFRIDDRSVTAAGSVVQIRKLILAERVSAISDANLLASPRR